MSGLFGGGGGNTGKLDVGNINIPSFTSSGGITPQQEALGQYSFGEDLLAQGNLFGGSGTGMSTMATQGAEGAKNTEAQTMAGFSDVNQGAQYGLYQNDVSAFEQQLQNQLQLNQANTAATDQSLTGLASLAGFGSGSGTSTNVNI